ncbi:SDR family oxidoreductase [Candidatus Pelagibacter ubique]|nr:SDR family oxidoreductase [Candidatus Pelagibacter ubique]
MKTILIIGSTGYIGKILKKNLSKDYSLICPSRKKGFDISNFKKLNKNLNKNIDIIINLSGQISTKTNLSKIILRGNQNIIKAIKNKKKPIVYYISTTLVYGYSSKLLNEKSATKPISDYAKIKLKGERIFNLSNINYKILRLANVYCNQKNNFIKNMIDSIKNPKKIFVNNVNSYRNYIHIDDVVKIITKIIKTDLKFTVYNIGHENISIKTMINTIEKKFKNKIHYIDNKVEKKIDSSQRLKKCKIFNEIKLYPKLNFNKFLDNCLKI